MTKKFVTEKYRDRRFKSLREYWQFIRSRKVSRLALGRQTEKGVGLASKEEGDGKQDSQDSTEQGGL
jgi:hypothetical protein